MKRSARVSVGEKYGISKIATAVNKKPTARETGPHRARNVPSRDHSRSTAMVTAAMSESARICRRGRFMVSRGKVSRRAPCLASRFRPVTGGDCNSSHKCPRKPLLVKWRVSVEKGHRGEILPGCEYRKGEECSREGLITRPLRGVVLALG